MEQFIFAVIYTAFVIWFLHQVRNIHRLYLRMEALSRIDEKIAYLINTGVLKEKKNSIFKYYGEIGSTNPKKVILLQAGVHGGLELFAIERLLDKVIGIDENMLIEQNIKVVIIPIVNQWGFENLKRTNRWFTDLARNGSYKSKHKNQRNLLKGWSLKKQPYALLLVLLLGKTWYFKGFSLQKETKTLMRIYDRYLRVFKEEFICLDFHTGNTSDVTQVWFPEEFKSVYPSYAKFIEKYSTAIIGEIDYGTDGGYFETVAMNSNIPFHGITIEFAVIKDYTDKKYLLRYLFKGSVFEPSKKEYEEMKQRAHKEIDVIFDAVL